MKIEMSYESKYLEFIQNGLQETIFEVEKKLTSKEVFF